MKDIYEIYNDVYNKRRKRFPNGFFTDKNGKETGIKLLQYIVNELKMTETEIQNISSIELNSVFKLDGLYRMYDYNLLQILKDAFPEIKFIEYYNREPYREMHSKITKNLSEEKWNNIKNGIRTNRYTEEYGKKLSDSQLGELNSSAKLKNEDIPKIRLMRTQGHSAIEIGGSFGVSRQTINDIIAGRTWKHLE